MKALSVKQFNEYVKTSLKYDPLFQNVTIEGEISNFKVSYDNMYFSLKEEDDLIDCVIFYYDEKDMQSYYNGDKVRVSGNIIYNSYSSKISIAIKDIEVSGLSEEYLEFLKLKETFNKRGYFDDKIKKDIVSYPKDVGLITSDKSAAVVDFISVINKEIQDINIYLYPVKVQGNMAKNEIIEAIRILDKKKLDCIVITRGGGSKEDLRVFNDGDLVEEIHMAKSPIISAIGHKIDTTLIDLVSDLSLQTPTEAGSYLVRNYSLLRKKFEMTYLEIKKIIKRQISLKEMEISYLEANLNLAKPLNLLKQRKKDLDEEFNKIKKVIRYNLERRVDKLNYLKLKLEVKKEILDIKKKSIQVKDENNKLIFSKHTIKNKDKIKIIFGDGEVKAQIYEKS